jgi:hypothetical protein
MKTKNGGHLIPVQDVDRAICTVRGVNVVLDEDLANLYGVETRVLVQAVKRNIERFPTDFMFQLSEPDFAALRSQSVTSNGRSGRGGRRYPPYAFTEHGAVMVASVLNSGRAVEVSVFVVRAFVRMQKMLAGRRELTMRLAELEQRIASHDVKILALFDAMRSLMKTPGRKP